AGGGPTPLWPRIEGRAAEPAAAPVDLRAPEPMAPAVIAPWTTSALEAPAGLVLPPPVAARARRIARTRPVQDEWGFFDPDQCGFAALIAKLEEMTRSA